MDATRSIVNTNNVILNRSCRDMGMGASYAENKFWNEDEVENYKDLNPSNSISFLFFSSLNGSHNPVPNLEISGSTLVEVRNCVHKEVMKYREATKRQWRNAMTKGGWWATKQDDNG
uniref:Uncharacterized protein n=1 Tax=Cucumis melo TaxID=3656 RepID=A0A9I9EDH7_CUCME